MEKKAFILETIQNINKEWISLIWMCGLSGLN
jgi:hypothetical protein